MIALHALVSLPLSPAQALASLQFLDLEDSLISADDALLISIVLLTLGIISAQLRMTHICIIIVLLQVKGLTWMHHKMIETFSWQRCRSTESMELILTENSSPQVGPDWGCPIGLLYYGQIQQFGWQWGWAVLSLWSIRKEVL